jgi:hypothetical protein
MKQSIFNASLLKKDGLRRGGVQSKGYKLLKTVCEIPAYSA